MRSGVHQAVIEKSFGPVKIHTPKAPALGLLLQEPVYNEYNRRFPQLANNTQCHAETLSFDAHEKEIDAFKERWIYSALFEQEQREHEYARWLMSLRKYPHVYAFMFPRNGNTDDGCGDLHPIYYELCQIGVNDPKRRAPAKRKLNENKKRSLMRVD